MHPTICKLLGTDHGPLVELMSEAREVPGIKKVLVASGIRMDLARRSPEYMQELAQHHVGGHLKVAPEHTDPDVLMKMRKPANDDFEKFTDVFNRESKKAGKKQYIVPYFIASHPASDLDAMINLAVFLKQNGYRPDQVQDFIPAPFDVATAHVLHRHRPVHQKAGPYRPPAPRPQAAAGPDAVLQARKLLRSPRSPAPGQTHRPDRRRLRLPHPQPPAQRSPPTPPPRRQPALRRQLCPHAAGNGARKAKAVAAAIRDAVIGRKSIERYRSATSV